MSVERDELHELVDALPEDQVAAAVDELRRRAQPRPFPSGAALAWIGMINDPRVPSDLATDVEKYLEGYGLTASVDDASWSSSTWA